MTQDAPGAGLARAAAITDRLRSPGGCPWDAEQTHTSLVRYLVEECFELVQALEDGDPAAVREELGDVLFQVLFHARIAAESPASAGGFDIDDVADGLVDKLVTRHPHVFAAADDAPLTASDQEVRWDEIKKAERARTQGRASVLDGVALAQPALALAGKLGSRSAKFDVQAPLPPDDSPAATIFRLAYALGRSGVDVEGAVRTVARGHAAAMLEAETAADASAAGDHSPGSVTPS